MNTKTFSATGFPVINDPLYNHEVFGTNKGKGGHIGKSDDQLIQDLIAIHNAENWSVDQVINPSLLIEFLLYTLIVK